MKSWMKIRCSSPSLSGKNFWLKDFIYRVNVETTLDETVSLSAHLFTTDSLSTMSISFVEKKTLMADESHTLLKKIIHF